MKTLVASCVALALAAAAAAQADPAWLVSPDEVGRDHRAQSAAPKSVSLPKGLTPGAPQIEIRQPGQLSGVKAPFPIQLGFKASDGADIDLKSFRVRYGFLKLDITDRLLKKAQLTRDGLSLPEAAIPPGQHRLLIRLVDTRARETELDVSLTVL